MKRRLAYDYVAENHLAFVEARPQSVFVVLSEISGFG